MRKTTMHIPLVLALAVIMVAGATAAHAADRRVKVTHRYLNMPISADTALHTITMSVGGRVVCRSAVRLADGTPHYWTFEDVSQWRGKTMTIHYDGPQSALDRMVLADSVYGGGEIGREPQRPQYHFTPRRGWVNDPNGLIYADGRYHMYFQHDPLDRDGHHKHWGHAVSTDLVHWQELPDALHPDLSGDIFSGSAVIDSANTAGFAAKGGAPVMVAAYTVDAPEAETQHIAYSTDGGLTFTPYAGNPVIDSHDKWQSHDTRDPWVFWYRPGGHWVMVLHERDGHSIYSSPDLRHWTYESHLTGFWECPGLFELPVDGNPSDRKWVLWGASGTYMVGTFDGRCFTPLTPKQCNVGGSAYAAQVFNGSVQHDGRMVKMVWGRIFFDGTPFNSVMLLPQEQRLERVSTGGWQLISSPVREVESLFDRVASGRDLTQHQADSLLAPFADDDVLRLRLTIEMTYATDGGLSFRGQRLVDYDLNGNRINGQFYASAQPGSMQLTADVYVDRSVVEVYVDGGRYSYSFGLDRRADRSRGYAFFGNQIRVRSLEVYRLRR